MKIDSEIIVGKFYLLPDMWKVYDLQNQLREDFA